MTRHAIAVQRPLFLVTVLALLASCSESGPVSPPRRASLDAIGAFNFSIAVNRGNNQTGAAGSALVMSPSVIVRSPWGTPTAGLPVFFEVVSGGGSVDQPESYTNEEGIASAGEWTLGPVSGTQKISAYFVLNGINSEPVFFEATATGGVTPESPTDPTAPPTDTSTAPPPAPPTTPTTDPVTPTPTEPSPAPSEPPPPPPVVTPAAPASVISLSATQQSAPVGTMVQDAPSVVVRDVSGNPVPNVTVTFAVISGGGQLTGATQSTNSSGVARVTSWLLGWAPGTNTVTASVDGLMPATFTATGTAAAVSLIEKTAGDNQTAPVGNPVPIAPRVRVVDANGNGLSGIVVTFTVESGGGSVDVDHVTTDGNGSASIDSWILGVTAGTNTLRASVAGGAAATFTATATVAQPTPPPTTDPTPPPTTDPAPPPTTEPTPPPTNKKPVASFTVTQSGGICTFDGTGSTDDAGIVAYTWRSSDAFRPVKTGPIITRFCDVGAAPWTEWLTVQDAGGLVDSTSRVVPSESAPTPPPSSDVSTVTVNTGTTFQTMTGWEATAEVGQTDVARYPQWRDAALDLAAADNINRLRVGVMSGYENTRDVFTEYKAGQITTSQWMCSRYTTVNDNANPFDLDMSKFQFGELDTTMLATVLPLKQRLQARGEALGVTITYVAFWSSCGGGQYVHADPEEYGEFAVATMTHLRDRFGVVPDTWEIINEPDNTSGIWSVDRLSAAIVAIDRRLKQAGFQVRLVAPSASGAAGSLNYYQALLATPAAALIDEIGWHRYDGPGAATVQQLGNLAAARGITTAMTEHIASDYNDLIIDLTLGRASTWEQYAVAYPTTDDGAQYYIPQGSGVVTASRMKYLRHYFRHVRRGAVRIGATSTSSSAVPVAFRNTNGQVTVVVKYTTGGTITVGGLPAGRYGVGFESATTSDGTMPDIIVGTNGTATLTLQSSGVVVLFGR